MKGKFENYFRIFLALLLVLLFWSVWTGMAQTNSAATAMGTVVAGQTNEVSHFEFAREILDDSNVTPQWVVHLGEDFPFLRHVWWGNEVWKYLCTLIFVILAFIISWIIDLLTRAWIKRWAKQTDVAISHPLLDLMGGPLKLVVFVVLLHIGFDALRWPAKVQLILNKGYILAAAAGVTYMLLKLIDFTMAYWQHAAQADSNSVLDTHLFPFFRKTFKVFVVMVAALVTAQNLKIDVTAALASLSIGGLAVGLAAQDTLSNFFGALALLVDKPFRIGDTIRLDTVTVEGMVESIGMRSTRVRTDKGFLFIIPNKTVGSAAITNLSRRVNIQGEINYRLAGDTTAEKTKRALSILDEIFRSNPNVLNPLVTFNKFADSGINIVVAYAWKGLDDAAQQAAIQQFNLQVQARFEAEGIRLALPNQTVYLRPEFGAGKDEGQSGSGAVKSS